MTDTIEPTQAALFPGMESNGKRGRGGRAAKPAQALTTAELDGLLPAVLDRAFKGEL
jgi:hypothetical protein